jgi:TolB-like protein/tetratricopeptide (TPR) repeat protein
MQIWFAEIKELETLYTSIKGRFPELEKDLEHLIKTDDENVALLYSRRCLEIVVTDLCECELNRSRGTEPLKGIIDKLGHEKKVPSNITASMEGLNTLSTFGTHPKEFDPEQVRPVLNNLKTILKWYFKFKSEKAETEERYGVQGAGYKVQEEGYKVQGTGYKVQGTGYKAEGAGDREKGVESRESGDLKKSNTSQKKWLTILVSGILLLAAIVVIVLLLTGIIGGSRQKEEPVKSIAVLPFINDSPDSANLLFCNGMLEDILDKLANIEDLDVKSRTDVEPYRGTKKSTKEIGKELGVENILEGSVRKQGNRFKISLQLIKAENGFHLWSDSYEGEYSEEIWTVQSDIAQQVASSLKIKLTPEEKESVVKLPTKDIRAYEYFIRGNDEMGKYWGDQDPRHAREAQRFYNLALEIDPEFEAALYIRAYNYIGLNQFDSAIIYANELVRIYPNSASGYSLKGYSYMTLRRPDDAIKNYQLAIKNYGRKDSASKSREEFYIGMTYAFEKNDYQKGLTWMQKGLSNEFMLAVKYFLLADAFSNIGDYDRVSKYFKKSFDCEITQISIGDFIKNMTYQSKYEEAFSFLDTVCVKQDRAIVCSHCRFNIYLAQKEFGKAEEQFNQFLILSGIPNISDSISLAYLYKETGKGDLSETILQNCQTSLGKKLFGIWDRQGYYLRYLYLAMVNAIMDRKAEAVSCLSQAFDNGLEGSWFDYAEVCPVFENLRDVPEFRALLNKVRAEKAAIRAQVNEMVKRGEINL